MKKDKIVYLSMTAELMHIGHLNIIKKASKLGKLIISINSDDNVAKYKDRPVIPTEQRIEILKNIKGVYKVVRRVDNNIFNWELEIKKYRPDYFVHGTDWKNKKSPVYKSRLNAIEMLKKYGGKLIEFEYTKEISTTEIKKRIIDKWKNKEMIK